jgi:plasmid stabilization system protein ParE
MENTYNIIWTDEALANLSDIFKYLEFRWTEKERRNFARLLERQITMIQSNPELFPASRTLYKLRKSVLSKQTSIYYRIDNNEIRIVSLFDNRQNPKRLQNKNAT